MRLLSPRRVQTTKAAVQLQRAARGRLARRSFREARAAATKIQMLFRSARGPAFSSAVLLIQSLTKGRLQRERVKAERLAAEAAERKAKAALKARMIDECTGILEKRGRRCGFCGRYEFVVWQERLVFADADALTYRHVRPNAEPCGSPRVIPFSSMQTIKALGGNILLVRSKARDHVFHLSSWDECMRWACNIVQLAAFAGHEVPGFVVEHERSAAR